jgi:hypothetical protein
LDFFRKGKDYFLKILGKAFIVNDPEEINSIGSISEFVKSKARNNELVILKVKITHADYSEKRKEGLSGRLLTSQIKEGFRNLFRFARPTEGAFFSRIPANQLVHSPVFSN